MDHRDEWIKGFIIAVLLWERADDVERRIRAKHKLAGADRMCDAKLRRSSHCILVILALFEWEHRKCAIRNQDKWPGP